jgi:hypothetical protein
MGGCGQTVRTDRSGAVKTPTGWKHGICHALDEADQKYQGLVDEAKLAMMLAGHRNNGGL